MWRTLRKIFFGGDAFCRQSVSRRVHTLGPPPSGKFSKFSAIFQTIKTKTTGSRALGNVVSSPGYHAKNNIPWPYSPLRSYFMDIFTASIAYVACLAVAGQNPVLIPGLRVRFGFKSHAQVVETYRISLFHGHQSKTNDFYTK